MNKYIQISFSLPNDRNRIFHKPSYKNGILEEVTKETVSSSLVKMSWLVNMNEEDVNLEIDQIRLLNRAVIYDIKLINK